MGLDLNNPLLQVSAVPEDFDEGKAKFFEENWEEPDYSEEDCEIEEVEIEIPGEVMEALELEQRAEAAGFRIVDLRQRLPGSPQPNQGSQNKTDGTVIHYNGPPTGVPSGRLSPIRLYHNDARYHMSVDWGGGARANGIQYHWGVWKERAFKLRNGRGILWHCGAWPWNGSATALNFPIGQGERAGRETLKTAAAFVLHNNRKQGRSRRAVRGHKQLSSTLCPGNLMGDFVRPLRKGRL